jgi:hypothetical protein
VTKNGETHGHDEAMEVMEKMELMEVMQIACRRDGNYVVMEMMEMMGANHESPLG